VDLATILGLVFGGGFVAMALVLGGGPDAYLDPVSLLIVVGGGAAATLTSVPLARFFAAHKVCRKAVVHSSIDPVEQVQRLVALAEIARRDGILALESRIDEIDDPFLVRGIEMAVDGTDPQVVRAILQKELENLLERHSEGRAVFESLGKYAPAFGMIGTLIGLVAMLSNMEDPSAMGAGMAAALLTTLYGALIANVVFLPLADKLSMRSTEEVLVRTMTIEGVTAIQAGENPRNVQSKLMTFLPPSHRTAPALARAA
jgi:chemotaxis protein MotA